MPGKSFIKDLQELEGRDIILQGWISNKRSGKGVVFLVLRDGTGYCQCVVAASVAGEESFHTADALGLESSLEVEGKVVKDERQVGGYEVQASRIRVYQDVRDYPIAKKEHGVDFLMDHRHLWLRSRRQWAILRVRNALIHSIHRFFQDRGFIQADAPILTGNACEGTSTLFSTEFFGMPAYLSQSGQLYGEAMAMAMGRIYTFGPTFRAEKSKTRRHLSEFWMIEPEMAFFDLAMNMNLIEEFIRQVVLDVVKKCGAELEMLGRDVAMLRKVSMPFPRLTYDEAVSVIRGEKDVDGRRSTDTLEKDLEEAGLRIKKMEISAEETGKALQKGGLSRKEMNRLQYEAATLKAGIAELRELADNIPGWIVSAKNFRHGNDFGGSDETVLTRLFDCPVMVHRWPREVKAFYMKQDETDPLYAKGVDVLAPEGFGEIVGGGERETNPDVLIAQINRHGLPMKEFEWYLDLRRYGSVPHSGFGLGLERLVAWVCGLHHVRETIPFPRMYGRLFP